MDLHIDILDDGCCYISINGKCFEEGNAKVITFSLTDPALLSSFLTIMQEIDCITVSDTE